MRAATLSSVAILTALILVALIVTATGMLEPVGDECPREGDSICLIDHY